MATVLLSSIGPPGRRRTRIRLPSIASSTIWPSAIENVRERVTQRPPADRLLDAPAGEHDGGLRVQDLALVAERLARLGGDGGASSVCGSATASASATAATTPAAPPATLRRRLRTSRGSPSRSAALKEGRSWGSSLADPVAQPFQSPRDALTHRRLARSGVGRDLVIVEFLEHSETDRFALIGREPLEVAERVQVRDVPLPGCAAARCPVGQRALLDRPEPRRQADRRRLGLHEGGHLGRDERASGL
jgi:hypothetical protein